MRRTPQWDHKQNAYLDEGDLRKFCKLCVRRRKQNPPEDNYGPVRACPKSSVHYSEMLPGLSLGQRNGMLIFGKTCEEVYEMPSRECRAWASMTDDELRTAQKDYAN